MKIPTYNNRATEGFSLLQLLITCSLLILIVLLAIPSLRSFKKHAVRMEIERLQAVCSFMQQLAMATEKDCFIQFDVHHNRYIADHKIYQLPEGVIFGCISGVNGPPGKPEKKITKPSTFKDNRITFYKNGVVQPGTIYLVNDKRSCMYALSSAVSFASAIRTYFYNNTWILHS